jgi:ATP-dependent RNA helicase DOB1
MNLIEKIIKGIDIETTTQRLLTSVYKNGPVSLTDMEIASYLALYQGESFEAIKNQLLNYMGVFYKHDVPRNTLPEAIFGQYGKYIREEYSHRYTPVQAQIARMATSNRYFSFSAPTSTGKSYVLRSMIQQAQSDVVLIVPSRALINEYLLRLKELVQEKSVNILTFIDRVNTKFARRNIFIVTPERCGDLFKQKNAFKVELFLFDEAQLSDDDSKRGLYFDSIVRRCSSHYPDAKFVFAHPFISNPEAQIEKHKFVLDRSTSKHYQQKNVGQLFLCVGDDNKFYHFGIDKESLGSRKVACDFDPIEEVIKRGGSALFYVSKSKIYNRTFLNEFGKYIDLCSDRSDMETDKFIEELKAYCGGDTVANKNFYSQIISLLKRGIVIHHGSLPLPMRLLIEEFTRKGFCKICFATSTLEQGVNMPFDVVYLDRLEASKPLSVKNIIGRGGRSSLEAKFDFGYVIVSSPNRIATLRKIMRTDEILDTVSSLEKSIEHDEDYEQFKEAILNGTYSDDYNLTENELKKLSEKDLDEVIHNILNAVFIDDEVRSPEELDGYTTSVLKMYDNFRRIYSVYLGRELSAGEQNVINTAIRIILLRIYGRSYKAICAYRYSYASKVREREQLERQGRKSDELEAAFITGYHDIPDRNLKAFSLFLKGTKAVNVDYDLIMYDTYDYMDKLIGFRLSDIFYATFWKYFERTNDDRAERLSKFVRYGTDNERYIWMLRYGLSFEDIDVFDHHIDSIDATQIAFKQSIWEISADIRKRVERFINQENTRPEQSFNN